MTDTQGKTTAATTGHPLENDTTLEKCIREHPLLRSKEATFYRPDRQLALQTGRQQARLHSELQMAFDSMTECVREARSFACHHTMVICLSKAHCQLVIPSNWALSDEFTIRIFATPVLAYWPTLSVLLT